jgi:hypothetical protein
LRDVIPGGTNFPAEMCRTEHKAADAGEGE